MKNCFIVCLGNKHELLNDCLDMLLTTLAHAWLLTLMFHTDLLDMFLNFIMCLYYLHVFGILIMNRSKLHIRPLSGLGVVFAYPDI